MYFCEIIGLIMKDTQYYDFQLEEQRIEKRLRYLFASIGHATIVKAIEYAPIHKLDDGRVVYNLGFGDYDSDTDNIADDVNSNNGDIYTVFNTVLNTIPDFFTHYPNGIIYVAGSDSTDDFAEKCKPTCKKRTKCNEGCVNIDRRINAYRSYVDKNFDDLTKTYAILGKKKETGTKFVTYIPEDNYHEILVYKK